MGVKGLWKLLEGTGQPVTLESLEGKVLAIDVSLWLNMAIKGMRDLHGHSASDAHLIILFHRICKLLYFGVKPVFVFDGKAPLLKQRTLQERREKKHVHVEQGKTASKKLLQNYLKRQVLKTAFKGKEEAGASHLEAQVFGTDQSIKEIKKTNLNEEEDLFKLPENRIEQDVLNSSDEEKEEQWHKRSSTREAVYGSAMAGDFKQMMAIDINSNEFNSLPTDIQHELLHDIKEIRKRRRTQIETMPEKSESFSNYQLKGILAKRALSGRIESIEKRMQEDNAMAMSMLGSDYELGDVKANRLISDENTHFVLINKLVKKSGVKNTESDADVAYLSSVASSSNRETHTANGTSSSDSSVEASSRSLLETEKNSNPTSSVDLLNSTEIVNASRLKQDEAMHDEVKSEALLSEQELISPLTPLGPAAAPSDKTSENDADLHDGFGVNPTLEQPTETESPHIETDKNLTAIESKVIREKIDENPDADDASHVVATEEPSNEPQTSASLDSVPEKCSISEDELDDFVEVQSENSLSEKSLVDIDSESSVAVNEPNPWPVIEDEEEFELLTEQLEAEDIQLIEKIRSSARAARDVSDVATTESQRLLQLFGVPYLVSPQEAESQCAFLNHAGLTVGTITDDSDVWLFGGRVVYKDVFAKKRDPTLYTANDIKIELGLERNHLINIALCSGSDYTAGIDGVGPVKALEIMQEFPGDGIASLKLFKEWWDSAHKQVTTFVKETKIRASLRKLVLPSSFPSELVVDAYLKPNVHESKNTFSWGMPDLDAIRDFLIGRLNWTKGKVDESLLPVLKRAAERNSQTMITSYFPRSAPLQRSKKKSKRVIRAITAISQPVSSEAAQESNKSKTISGRKRTKKTTSKTISSKRVSSSQEELCLSESSDSS